MKLTPFFLLLLAAASGAGCSKSIKSISSLTETNATPGYEVPPGPQPRLQTLEIYLGPETLDAELAMTPMQQATGLMYRTNIDDTTAMLFLMGQPMLPPNGFWMTNCPISLSAAYIGPDGVIEEIHHLEKEDNVPVMATNDNIVYVLEVNDGWFTRHNINPGTLIRTERGSFEQTFTH